MFPNYSYYIYFYAFIETTINYLFRILSDVYCIACMTMLFLCTWILTITYCVYTYIHILLRSILTMSHIICMILLFICTLYIIVCICLLILHCILLVYIYYILYGFLVLVCVILYCTSLHDFMMYYLHAIYIYMYI